MSDPFDVLRDDLVRIAARSPRLVRGRRWWSRRPSHRLAVALAICVVGGSAAAAATTALTGQQSRPQNGSLPTGFAIGPVASNRYRVELVPDLKAGEAASWCTTFEFLSNNRATSFATGGCIGRDGPVTAPGGASQPGSGDRWILYDVLSPQVAAVRISGVKRLVIPVTGRGLPYGWNIAVAIARSTRSVAIPGPKGTHVRFYLPPQTTLLNARLQPVAIAKHPRQTTLPTRTVDPARPPTGRCAIRTEPLLGLRALRETILRTPPPPTLETGEPGYLSCASLQLQYNGTPVIAAILLDAQHPGQRPPPLPDTHPLPNNPDTYTGTGAEQVGFNGFNETAALITHRIENAWLVIQGPDNLQQRQRILHALHATP